MSEDKPQVDSSTIEDPKEQLSHVDTKTGASIKPVFKCSVCGQTEVIPAELLQYIEEEEGYQPDPPEHCDKIMQISVVG